MRTNNVAFDIAAKRTRFLPDHSGALHPCSSKGPEHGWIVEEARLAMCSVVTGSTPRLPAICPGSGLILGSRSEDVHGRL
jgi:hypothetical protein